MKKAFFILLGIMLLFISFPVHAADGQEKTVLYKIVVNGAVENQTYKAYKIFDYGIDTDGKYTYTISGDSVWYDVVKEISSLEFSLSEDGEGYFVRMKSNFDAEGFANMLYENIPEYAVYKYQIADNSGEVSIDVGEQGYYFVTTTLGSLCSLNTTTPVAEIQEKNIFPDIDKNVLDTEANEYVKKTSASVGDTVSFKTELRDLHLSEGDVIIYDKMSDGLSLVSGSIRMEKDEENVDVSNYTVEYSVDDVDFKITLSEHYIGTLESSDVVKIFYSATLNDDAFGESVNTTYLQYGAYSSEEVSASVENFNMDIVKVNETKTVIQGAEFLLYDALTGGNVIPVKKIGENVYRPALAGEQGEKITVGKAVIKGFGKRTLYIEEVTAPQYYNRLDGRITVHLSKNMIASFESTLYGDQYIDGGVAVTNHAGFLLPATGGKGILLISGGGLMIAALSFMLFIKKSKRVEYEKE